MLVLTLDGVTEKICTFRLTDTYEGGNYYRHIFATLNVMSLP
jgi:hypothetical protein